MKLTLKITEALIREVRKDLDRAHPYAALAVGVESSSSEVVMRVFPMLDMLRITVLGP